MPTIGLRRTMREDTKKCRQSNDIDCGIFLITYADCHTQHRSSDFTKNDISQKLRLHISVDLIRRFVTPVSRPSGKLYLENTTFVGQHMR